MAWKFLRLRRAAALILAGGLSLALAAPASAEGVLDRMLSEKTLNVGWITSPPGSFKDPKTGEIGGYYIDIVRYILEQVNVKPVLKETKWSDFAAGLQAGQFDIVAAGTFASIPRAAAVSFTDPIFYLGYSAAVRKGDTRFETLADIDQPGIKVAVVQGSGGHEFVKRAMENVEVVALNAAELTASLIAVQMGRADVAIEDAWATKRYVDEHPQMVNLFEDTPYNLQPIGWALRIQDHALRNFFNTALDWMRINGKIEEFVKKYPASGRYVAMEKYRAIE